MARPKKELENNFPKDFSITAYEPCAKWSSKDWYEALLYRVDLFEKIRRARRGFPRHYLKEEELRRYRKELDELMADPISKVSEISSFDFERKAIIADQTIYDFFEGCEQVESNESYRHRYWLCKSAFEDGGLCDVNGRNWTELSFAEIDELVYSPAWLMHYGIRMGQRQKLGLERYFISVDLNAADRDLERQFKNWLKNIRTATGVISPEKYYGEADFEEWHKNCYLPFVDIDLWSILNGDVTYRSMVDRLFGCESSHSNGVVMDIDNFRKTVAKNASKWFSYETVWALKKQLKYTASHGD